ncbi:GEVED domain-containing protein [Labilibaculum euxinus]
MDNSTPYTFLKHFLLLIIFCCWQSGSLSAQTYCSSYGNVIYNTGITLVNINSINNSTGKSTGYSDYTSQSTNLIIGDSYNLSVNVNTDGNYRIYARAWIDWNQDGDFNDSGEEFNLGRAKNKSNGSTSNSPYTITVPSGASLGLTRLRIILQITILTLMSVMLILMVK